MSDKETKVSILKKRYQNSPEKELISLREFIENESLKSGFWSWFFDAEVDIPLEIEYQNKFNAFLNRVDQIAKRRKKIKNKDVDIHIKISSSEKEFIKKNAEKLGITLSSYVRNVVLRNKIVVKTDLEMVRQVRKIGVNINQIAYKINRESSPRNVNIGLFELKEYMEILKNIMNIIEG